MQTALPTLAIIGLSIFAFTANAISTEDKIINTAALTESVDQVYRNNQYGFSLRHPDSWVIQENNQGNIKKLILKSPDGFIIALSAKPQESQGDCQVDQQKVMGTDSLSILGNNLTVHFVGDKNENTITYAYVISSTDPCPAFSYMSLPNKGMVQIELYFEKLAKQPKDTFTADDYQTAKDILSSIAL